MPCCNEQLTYFHKKNTTDVPYDGQFGRAPKVTVLYFLDGHWRTMEGMTTQITLGYSDPTNNINSRSYSTIVHATPTNNSFINNIHVDHGGPATGVIRLS